MEQVFNKLVRDNIPNIIESNGETAITRILSDDEYRIELYKKLFEESHEVINSQTSEDTLEELADKLNIPREKFLAAVDKYNETCGVEVEEMTPFGLMKWPPKKEMKDGSGPFYALKEKLFHENAIGGIVIDGGMHALSGGKPVKGLYACGDNTRGIMVPGKVGVAYVESVISALTFAFSSGYAVGEECVKNAHA